MTLQELEETFGSASVFRFDPEAVYLIVAQKEAVNGKLLERLLDVLKQCGVQAVGCLVDDPSEDITAWAFPAPLRSLVVAPVDKPVRSESGAKNG